MKHFYQLVVLVATLCFYTGGYAQLSSSASGETQTNYASGEQDQIFVFCTSQGVAAGDLTAQFSTGAAASFEWQKYNQASAGFETFQTDNSGGVSSQVSGLGDGGYRVNVVSGGSTQTYTAWVFNNWYEVTAAISESACEYFQLEGAFSEAVFNYTDLTNGNSLLLVKNVQVKWETGSDLLSSVISPRIYFPPSANTTYQLTVYDALGCSASASVYYESVVPAAAFTADPLTGEAPLEVAFTNQSQNADSYEWLFFRDIAEIREEAAAQGSVSDSIMDVGIDTSPDYVYDSTGEYMVKLVATKTGTATTCRDTVYLADYISVVASAFDVPNVFTPNGDGSNDYFIVKFTSMKSLDVKIFNRWGKQVFSVSKNDLGAYNDSRLDAAWDGKISGKYASPGVYYYVIEGLGRDDVRYKKQGYVHLFRGK
ncbi:MAG: gliding motility-associated C-terminal domain-containing protein [Mangrovibacterium sp.]